MRERIIPESYRKHIERNNTLSNQTLEIANRVSHSRGSEDAFLRHYSSVPCERKAREVYESQFGALLTRAAKKGLVVFDNPAVMQVTGLKISPDYQNLAFVHIDRLTGNNESNQLTNYRIEVHFDNMSQMKLLLRGESKDNSPRQIILSTVGKIASKDFFIVAAHDGDLMTRNHLLVHKNGRIYTRIPS